VMLPFLLWHGMGVFYTRRIGTHFLRGIFNSIAILAWFWALTLMPLADATALNLLAPLMVTAGAILFLREKVGSRRWMALGLGAVGGLAIIRPGFQDISLGVWLALATVVFSAVQRIMAKSLATTESNVTSFLYLLGFMIPATFVASLIVWVWPAPADYAWLAVIGALLSAGHFALMKSLQLADVSALEPVNFTRLLWGALLGYLFFAEVPDIWIWVGGVMIISATTYVARREAALLSN
ncbi:MAG: DMT family transporter, partial [Pseudomonadota bacterium]|nr:DMT family transporter [Pseudomonadota bacterium]